MRNLLLVLLTLTLLGSMACKKNKNKIAGCMDPNAINYNPEAEVDDGSCTFAATVLKGNINEDMTLTDWNTGVDYIIDNRISVYAKITVEPGVEIEVKENGGIYVYQNSSGIGAFYAVGTLDKPIIIRGAETNKGYWDKIYINSSSGSNVFNYVIIRHGGGVPYSGEKAMMQVGANGGSMEICKIQNCLFEESNGYGLFVYEKQADISGYSKNTFRNNNNYPLSIGVETFTQLDGNSSTYELTNAVNMIEVTGRGRGEFNGTHVWKNPGVPLHIKETVEVGASGSVADLTVTEGVEMIFEGGKGFDVYYSTITIQGTAAAPVKMNSTIKTPGSWRGLHIGTNNPKNVINYLEISNGGMQGWHAVSKKSNIQVGDAYNTTASLTINNSIVQNSPDCGIFVKVNGTLNATGVTYNNNGTDTCTD